MKKLLVLLLLFLLSCGPTEEEIQEQIDEAVEEAVEDVLEEIATTTSSTTTIPPTTTSSTTTSSTTTTTTIPINNIEIGIMAPLTGDLAFLGPQFEQASKLAISEVNFEISSYGYQFVPFVQDDSCSDKIIDNFQEILDKNITYIIGPACSYDLRKLIESGKIKESPNLVLISPTASDPVLLNLLSDSIYTLHPEGALDFDPSEDFVEKYDSFLKSQNGTELSSGYSRINEARYYDSTYIIMLLLIDYFINENVLDFKLENYTNNGTKCNTSECINLLLSGNNIDYIGAIGDFEITNNHSNK